MLPYDNSSVSDVATDDAVTNDKESGYSKMALGSWASNNNPMEQWQARKAAIQYLNTFLGIADQVSWAENEVTNRMFIDKLSGEAYALRALNYYYLLMAHGGWTADGQLLGVPILLEPEDNNSDFNQPRASFSACVEQVFTDLNKAVDLLPVDYENIKSDAEVPARYKEIGAKMGNYNLVFGTYQRGRITARIAEAIKAQVALLAASPAYREGSGVTSETAANYAATVLNRIGGVAGLDPTGNTWYMNTSDLDNLGSGEVPAEILWRGNKSNGTADWDIGIQLEKNNFPPTLYGSGRINPTQNLVDAFPMANGYPITDERSGYDPQNPYEGRDARFYSTIFYNQSEARDTKNGLIHKFESWVYEDANEGKILGEDYAGNPKTSLTNYHIKKFLYKNYNPNVTSMTAAGPRSKFIYRWAHVVLDFAEAANEVVGPTTEIYGLTAKEAISWLRKRKTTDGTESSYATSDPYLDEVSIDKDKFREFIRNERRLETCFEGMRFFDLQRWSTEDDLSLLNAVVHRPEIVRNLAGGFEYSEGTAEKPYVVVATRKFTSPYIPLPYDEILRVDELEQNMGWKAWE